VTGAKPQRYSDADINTMALLASQAAGHLENVRLYENIHAASTRIRAILDSTREGIILLDPDGRLIEANASAEYLLNIDMEDHIGQNFVEFLITHLSSHSDEEQDALTHESLTDMARILRLEPERITRRSLEIIKDGKPRYIEEVGSPVTNNRGHILGRLLTLRDVTEERLLEAYRNEISSMVIHDLRGPLGNIISSHIVMQEIADELGDPALPPLLEVSLDSATALMNLVDSLLDIARLETRRMPLKRSVLSVNDLVESAYQVLATSIANAKITVERDIPDDLPDVDVDGDKIRRVIINVLDNAVRFSPLGGKVHVSAQKRDTKIVLRVSDSGPGIPAEERERIFEKFRQVKMNIPQRGSKGSGLGLTFCKLAIEAHRENIWVDQSEVLPGASFNFTLPIAH
jgi:PAS domain S-box-containing protein